MTSNPPTIDDVAALCGVGRTTVSRVINGGPNVSEKKRIKVLKAIEQLDYKVNTQARFLAGGRSQTIALLHMSDFDTEPNSFYYSGLELGALRACSQMGFQLLMQPITQNMTANIENSIEKVLDIVKSRRADGLILTPPFSDNLDLVTAINAQSYPLVCIASGHETRKLACGIGIDDEVAGYEIAKYMLSLGHRRLGYIKGLAGHLSAEDRFVGFMRALNEAGLGEADAVTERGNFTFKSGSEKAHSILTAPQRPTVVICANDDMAAGALLAAHKVGLMIPNDVSIVGFDDTPVSEIIWPPLTTVHQPIKTMGYRAVEMLIQQIKSPIKAAESALAITFEHAPHRVVVRDSTGPFLL